MNLITNSFAIVKPRSLSCLKTSGSNYAMPFHTVASDPRWLTCLRTLINMEVEGEAQLEKQHSKWGWDCHRLCLYPVLSSMVSVQHQFLAQVNAQDDSKHILQTVLMWALVHWVWSHIYLHGCRSKAAFYNSVALVPVWKRCERTFRFAQCSMAISPLKKLFWTNRQDSKSLWIFLWECGGQAWSFYCLHIVFCP